MSINLRPLIQLADAHAAADEYRRGYYWRDDPGAPSGGRGCSLGCTLHDGQTIGLIAPDVDTNNHQAAADLLYCGQVWVALLQDRLHEAQSAERVPGWTPRLLRSVIDENSGQLYRVDWRRVWHRWAAALLDRLTAIANPSAVVSRVRDLHRRALAGDLPSKGEWAAASGDASDVKDAAWFVWAAAEDAGAGGRATAARAFSTSAAGEAAMAVSTSTAGIALVEVGAGAAAEAMGSDARAAGAATYAAWAAEAEADRQADDLIAAIEAERTGGSGSPGDSEIV